MDRQTAGGPEGRGWERGRDGRAKAQRQRHTPEGVRPLRPWPQVTRSGRGEAACEGHGGVSAPSSAGLPGVRPAGSLQPGVPSAQRTPTTSARRGGCGPAHLSHCQALRWGTRLQDGEASLPEQQHLRRDVCAVAGLGKSGEAAPPHCSEQGSNVLGAGAGPGASPRPRSPWQTSGSLSHSTASWLQTAPRMPPSNARLALLVTSLPLCPPRV